MERYYAVIDIKAFYASFECVERGLDPFTTPLVVTDTERKESTIVLSVTPYLKALGVPSRCRRKDLPTNIPNMIYAVPQMEKYVKKSAEVVSIFLDYFGIDDIHVYSIDESFIDLTPYLRLYKKTPYDLCREIQQKIYEKTKLTVTCGIGPNMFLAKMADDKDAKNAPNFIAQRTKNSIPEKLRPIKPLSEMWGISSGYQKRLNTLGIYSVFDLAHADKEMLISKLGIMGAELWEHANGIDDTDIREKYIPINKNLSLGQVLMKDYRKDEAILIVREMCDDLCSRLRRNHLEANKVYLFVRYTFSQEGGFNHQVDLLRSTSNNDEIFEALKYLYNTYTPDDALIRQIGISFTNLKKSTKQQLSIFKSVEKEDTTMNLYLAMDEIQAKFGKNSVLRGTSLLKNSTAKERHNQIGGHRK
ncbi:MAG: damage repair protein [Candidatus Onthovivens sp.]|nr:damage repair protein [Candidatus Onthovivens sp.]